VVSVFSVLAPLQLAANAPPWVRRLPAKVRKACLFDSMPVGIKGCMETLCWLILVTAVYPLLRAWQANRRTSLIQAAHWAIVAWGAWGVALGTAWSSSLSVVTAGSYIGLCLTGCAGVAVLGARRPGVSAWNFVVVALLAVDLLPLAKEVLTAKASHLDTLHLMCVAATIVVTVLNYLPTRLAPAALLLAAGCGLVFDALVADSDSVNRRRRILEIGWLAIVCVPWVAYWSMHGPGSAPSEFDRLWLDYRNRFGLVWAQRLREQFNRSAAHAGWAVVLRWQGLRLLPGATLPGSGIQEEIVATLRSLMKRFRSEEDQPAPTEMGGPAEGSKRT